MPTFMEPISLTAATATLTKDHAGTTLFLNRAGGITVTLPAPDAGLVFKFIVGTAPTTAYTINSSGGADIIVLSVNELETDTGDDGPYDNDADIVSFVANVAVVGDFLDIHCDGTKWYARGQTNADGAITSGTT
jgi:hypothetical protein